MYFFIGKCRVHPVLEWVFQVSIVVRYLHQVDQLFRNRRFIVCIHSYSLLLFINFVFDKELRFFPQIGTEADSYLECLQLMQENLNARDEYLTFILPDNTVLSHVIQRGGKFKMDFPRVILASYLEVSWYKRKQKALVRPLFLGACEKMDGPDLADPGASRLEIL